MKKSLLLTAALVGSLYATPAIAQDGTQAAGDQLLDEVISTATRTGGEDIMDIPIAVSSFNAEALEAAGVVDIIDLNIAVPSVFSNSLSSPLANFPVRIRGIGTGGGNPGFESAVGMYVDDVYRSRPGAAFTTLFDMAGVDVLRGPQGTLFGKNTTAGAITIRTAEPKIGEFEAMLSAGFENYGGRSVEGMFNAPIGDEAAFRLSGAYSETDGFFTNPITGEDTADNTNAGIRAQLGLEPSDDLSVRLMADFSSWEDSGNYGVSSRIDNRDIGGAQAGFFAPLAFNAIPGFEGGANYWYWDFTTPGAEADPFAREIVTQQKGEQDLTQWGLSATVDYEINDSFSLKSITSYRELDSDNLNGDWDFGPLDFANTLDVNQDFETFSQEFLLSADLGDSLDLLAGVHYFDETIGYERRASANPQVAALLIPAGAGAIGQAGTNPDYFFQDIASVQDEQSYGVFGQVTFDVTEQISLIGGLRWNKIDKDYDYQNLAAPTPEQYFNDVLNNASVFLLADAGLATAFPFSSETSDEELTYNATVQYRPNDDMQLYASYARGFKAGGFNLTENAAAGEPSLGRFDPTNPDSIVIPAPLTGPLGPTFQFGLGVPFTLFAPFTPDSADFAPEFVDSFEAGLRWEYGGRGRLSLNGFYSDYSDLQVSVFNGLTFEVINAGTSKTQGIEIENTFAVSDDLKLNLAATYMNTEYGTDAGTLSTGLPAGRDRGLAPDLAIVASANYERPLSDSINMYANANFSYYTEMFLAEGSCRDAMGAGTTYDNCSTGALAMDADNQLTQQTQDAYGVVGASLGFRLDSGFDVSAYCRNCFDQDYFTYAFNQPFVSGGAPMGNLGDPRVYGLRLKKTFR